MMTAAEITREWLATRREIIVREGRAVRAGWLDVTIEVKGLIDNEWHPLSLKENSPALVTTFATTVDRDIILAKLTGQIPL